MLALITLLVFTTTLSRAVVVGPAHKSKEVKRMNFYGSTEPSIGVVGPATKNE